MTIDELRAVSARVRARYRPYASADLSGMAMDCQAHLEQSALLRLARRKMKKTGDEDAMLVVRCEPASATVTIQDIVAELDRIWLDDLRFTEEAHTVVRSREDIVLAFVTWWPESTGSYVTGQIVVDIRPRAATPHGATARE